LQQGKYNLLAIIYSLIFRIRPQNIREKALNYSVSIKANDKEVTVNSDKTFGFNYVFDRDATQTDIYTTCVKDLVAGVFNGLNATILAYGQASI
jgi:hypothetical protein